MVYTTPGVATNSTHAIHGTGCMQIYVSNIPKGTRPAEIKKLLRDSFKDHVFGKLYEHMLNRGAFEDDVDIDIVHHKPNGTNHDYRYGHLSISSKGLARVAIEALEGREIRGSTISARPYTPRESRNDRRRPDWRDVPWSGTCRRNSERRLEN